jgi:hypothetical protein
MDGIARRKGKKSSSVLLLWSIRSIQTIVLHELGRVQKEHGEHMVIHDKVEEKEESRTGKTKDP